MDIRVQELLDRIKRDGTDKAEAEAAEILSAAETKRKAMLEAAEKEAGAIIEKANHNAARTEEAGRAALVQASRDLVLAFKGEIQKILHVIVKNDVQAAFHADVMQKALPAILEAMAKNSNDDLSVMVAPAELAPLEAFFKDKLAAELKRGVTLKPLKDSASGFRIVEKDGAAYYDYSAEAVADMLSAYLNTKLAALCKEAAGTSA